MRPPDEKRIPGIVLVLLSLAEMRGTMSRPHQAWCWRRDLS